MENERRIIATIVVTHQLPRCVIAKACPERRRRVDGQARWFPDLGAVFRQALALQDNNGQDLDPPAVPRDRPEWAWQPSMEL